MRAYERLLRYVTVPTKSDDASESTPSTPEQWDLARLLVEELQSLGVTNAEVDDLCYVYASIPATKGMENAPAIGFIALALILWFWYPLHKARVEENVEFLRKRREG